MHDFVPLAVMLRAEDAGAAAPPDISFETAPLDTPELCETIGELRRFRAALADALEGALVTLLRDIAADVVARELQVTPVDLAAIARHAVRRLDGEWPIRVRAHPDEVGTLHSLDLNVVADAALRRGDLAIDLRSGTIDLTLGARLAAALACVR